MTERLHSQSTNPYSVLSFLPEKYLHLRILQLKLKMFFYDEVLIIRTLTYLED